MKKIALIAIAASLTGCMVTVKVTKTKDSTTVEYTAPAFGAKHIKKFQLDKDLFLEGYGSIQSDIATVFNAGIEAGKVLAKP